MSVAEFPIWDRVQPKAAALARRRDLRGVWRLAVWFAWIWPGSLTREANGCWRAHGPQGRQRMRWRVVMGLSRLGTWSWPSRLGPGRWGHVCRPKPVLLFWWPFPAMKSPRRWQWCAFGGLAVLAAVTALAAPGFFAHQRSQREAGQIARAAMLRGMVGSPPSGAPAPQLTGGAPGVPGAANRISHRGLRPANPPSGPADGTEPSDTGIDVDLGDGPITPLSQFEGTDPSNITPVSNEGGDAGDGGGFGGGGGSGGGASGGGAGGGAGGGGSGGGQPPTGQTPPETSQPQVPPFPEDELVFFDPPAGPPPVTVFDPTDPRGPTGPQPGQNLIGGPDGDDDGPSFDPPKTETPLGTPDPDLTPTAVPEPGAWVMLIGGFGAIGLALRRRRSLAAA